MNKDGYPCIDKETLFLTAEYIGARKRGPLIRGWRGTPLTRHAIWYIVKRTARRAGVRCADKISPRTLKYIFATTWLKPKPVPFLVRCPCCERAFRVFIPLPGSVGTLQKQLSHKHLESTAAYLRFVMDDVRPEYDRLMRYVQAVQSGSLPIGATKKREVREWVETLGSMQREADVLEQLTNLEVWEKGR
jgi:integrase